VTEHSPTCRGHFWRDASGRLIYELHHVAGDDYRSLCEVVRRKFWLAASSELVADFLGDVAFQEFDSKAGTVSLEWDNWSEFMVVAINAESEPLVEAIGAFLGSNAAIDRYLRPT
jgi:hypothetical protein